MTRHMSALTVLMALLGLWAFAMTGAASPALIAVTAVAYAAGCVSQIKKVQVPQKAWNIVALPVFALFAADYLFISGDMILAGSRLLAALLCLRLFDLRRIRDYLLAYTLVFFQLLAAAASTISLSFFVLLALFVMASIWAIVLFNMLRDVHASASRMSAPDNLFGPGFFAAVAILTAVSLAVTLALFYLIPRMGVGVFQRKSLTALKSVGFSDTVDLGALGPLKGDTDIVMRAEFPAGRPKGTVYFKGATLFEYDGRSWSREEARSFVKRAGPEGFDLSTGQGKETEFSVLLEPIDTEVLFLAPNVSRLNGSFQTIWVENSGAVRLPSPPFTRVEYRAWTDLSKVNRYEGAPDDLAPDEYLESSPEGGRIKGLAARVAQGQSAIEKALAIERYLKANYKYTLSPEATGENGPLEEFLFVSKEGYCEHFATSMAMLLRAAGVPSRLVNGFLEGEWNELGSYFIIRQQDAHSWVEAYIDGVGWMRFDPTPSASAPRPGPSALSLYLDLMKLKWNRYIIQFSFSDQKGMAILAESRARDFYNGLKAAFIEGKAHPVKGLWPYAGEVVAFVLSLILLKMVLGRRHPGQKGPAYYFDMERALAERGIKRGPSETPFEFAKRTRDRRVMEITEAYHLERYGRVKAEGEKLARLRAAVRELRKG